MTRKELTDNLAARFAAGNIENAKAEAEQLACFCFSCSYSELKLHGEQPVSADMSDRLSQMADERLSGRPLQYVIGSAPFGELELRVDERVLIPRPETEELLALAEEEVRRRLARTAVSADEPFPAAPASGIQDPSPVRVLDLCTGSGALAAGLAHAFAEEPRVQITATDLSAAALAVARINCPASVTLLQGDLFEPLAESTRFDVIVSNPPYIPTGVIAGLQREVRCCEPHLALDGGTDGLVIIRRIAAALPQYLSPGGVLLMEIGDDQGNAMRALLPGCEVLTDLQGKERMVRSLKRL